MVSVVARLVMVWPLFLLMPEAHADSYRYMHVSIDTPWVIFLFLTVVILLPFFLMAFLYWRNAIRKNAETGDEN